MEPQKSQELMLTDRKMLKVTGVAAVEEFDDKNVRLTLREGGLDIAGSGLSVSRLDLGAGVCEITGLVVQLKYRGQRESIVKRLLR